MPIDTLKDDVEPVIRAASDYLRSNRPEERMREQHIANLTNAQHRLSADLQQRTTTYLQELEEKEAREVDARSAELRSDPKFERISAEHTSRRQTFENLRQANEGAYPN